MLVLFDIDLTLLDARNAGRGCVASAAQAVFGASGSIDGVDFVGRLDPLIFADVCVASGAEHTPEHAARLRELYAAALTDALLHTPPFALPGGLDLVAAVHHDTRLTSGVLTGNFPETGTAKLRAAGYDPAMFAVTAWGDDAPGDPPHRSALLAIALTRAAGLGCTIDPAEVVIIGDTPHDVACARDNGCRVIAVATGRTSRDELVATGAHLVLDDLTSTPEIMAWITNG